MRTLLWSYLGARRFPRDMSAFELRHFFSFSIADRRELRVRYPRRPRLGAALQLGFVRMTGTTLDVAFAWNQTATRIQFLPCLAPSFWVSIYVRGSTACTIGTCTYREALMSPAHLPIWSGKMYRLHPLSPAGINCCTSPPQLKKVGDRRPMSSSDLAAPRAVT